MKSYANPDALVETAWLEQHLSDPSIRVVECNEDALLYAEGHIPGAVNVDWYSDLNDHVVRDYISTEAFARLNERLGITREDTVIFYGDRSNWWAAYALWVYRLFGHTKVKLLNGGRDKWLAESRPFTKERTRPAPAPYAAPSDRLDSLIRAFRADVMIQSWQGQPLIDVRSAGEFRGDVTHMPEYPQEGVLRGGHIPGAVSVPWTTAVQPDGTFKPVEELQAVYEPLIGEFQSPIVYCRIGERASHTWFVLHYLLGIHGARNYDGSWTEYGNLVRVPVTRGDN